MSWDRYMKAAALSLLNYRRIAVPTLLLWSISGQAVGSCPQWSRSAEGQRHLQQAQKAGAEASVGYERCKAQGAASIARLACDAEVYRGYVASRERNQAAEQAALASFRQQPGNCVAAAAPAAAPRPAVQVLPPASVPQPSSGFVLEPEAEAPRQVMAEPFKAPVEDTPVPMPAPVTLAAPASAPEPVAVAPAAVPPPAAATELPPMPAPARFRNCRGVPPILEAYSPHGSSFSARAETAMFTIDAALQQIESQCRFLVDYRDMRRELDDARTRFEQACSAARVDGKRCEARRHN